MPTTAALDQRVPVVLAAGAVLLQVAYPLVHGSARDALTVVSVVAFCAAGLSHALVTRGPAWTGRLLATCLGVGFTAEVVGVATGYPFGSYSYTGSLGPRLLSVPLVVPLAWTMLGYPCLLVGQRLATGWRAVAVGAWGLTAWDLFLDPQMVDAGQWHWDHPSPGLNGIPLTNAAGWLLVATVLMVLLARLPRVEADDRLPGGLLLWTYGSSVLADLAFFDRPGVALAGGVGLGLVAVPFARSLAR